MTLDDKLLSFIRAKKLRRLVLAALIMFMWLLVWILVLKLCDEAILLRNYGNLKTMTVHERLEWDSIPFNYRGSEYEIMLQKLTTLLNCFILVPLGVMLQYLFGGRRIALGAIISFLFVLCIELLQLYTMFGNFATEDFITNMVGYFIGVALYQLVFRRLSHRVSIVVFVSSVVILAAIALFSFVSIYNIHDTLFKMLTHSI